MPFLLLLVILSGMLHITGLYVKSASLKMIFKPLTTVLIIVSAFRQNGPESYQFLLVTGLVFSLAGDIFLMLPRERFIAGLVSFLVAHLFFIAAFVIPDGPFLNWIYLTPIFVYFVLFLNILWKHTAKMSVPVGIYSFVLLLFLWQAAGRYGFFHSDTALFGLWGALLFVLSDSLLAYNKFVKPLKWAPGVLMILYWTALYFLILSI